MTMVDGRRYWLMALGKEAELWGSCHTEGVACMGDDDVGDLWLYDTKDQLKKQGHGTNDVLAYWQFCREMARGDTIFVKKGKRLLLGHGVVRSDYRFDEARRKYKHVRDVEWSPRSEPREIGGKGLAPKTLTEITDPDRVADFKRALNIEDSRSEAWSALLNRIRGCRAAPSFEADEVTYKVEVAAQVNAARERLRSGAEGWEDLLRHAFNHKLNNLTDYRYHDPFLKWMEREPDRCRDALHALWSVDGPPEERLQGFCDQVPTKSLGTLGGRLNIGTFLLMAEDVHRLPPAKIDAFRRAWKLGGRGNGPTGEEPGAVYGDILRFLDELVREGGEWPVPLRDRLDAQGAVWWATRQDGGKNGPDPPPRDAYTLEHARRDLFLSADEIESLVKLLERKKNLVLQGPPSPVS